MAQKVISVLLNAVVGPYQAAMARAAGTTQAFGAAATGAGKSVGNVATSTGLLSSKLLGAAGTAFAIKQVADAAINWESAFAGVRKTVNGTEEELSALGRELQRMAGDIPVSAGELAAVAEAAGQLGVETENIVAFTETMASLGVTTNLSATEAATQLARFANIMGTAQTDFDRLGSSIVALGNNFATTEAEIVTMGQRLAAAGEIAGLSEGDVLGFATALSSVGVEAQAGGTALSKVFTSVRDAVLDGGDKLRTFARVAGTSVSGFRQAFEDDAATAIAAFIAGLGRINEAGGSTTAIFEELELTDQRLMRALLSTASAGDLLTEAIGEGNDAFDENIALQREADVRFDTTESKIKTLGGELGRLASTVGSVPASLIGDGADAAATAVGFVNEYIDAINNPGNTDAMEDHLDSVAEALNTASFATAGMTGEVNGLNLSMEELDAWADEETASWAELDTVLGDATGTTGDLADAQDDLGGSVEDTNLTLAEQHELLMRSVDPVFNLVSALGDVEDAQDNYNDAVEEFGPSSDEAAEAATRLAERVAAAEAAAIDGDLSYGAFRESLDRWVASGALTSEQADTIAERVAAARGEAERYEGTYRASIEADGSQALRTIAEIREAMRTMSPEVRAGVSVELGGTRPGTGGHQAHTGGTIGMLGGTPRSMTSGLRADEFPTVLQRGETVMSRGDTQMVTRLLNQLEQSNSGGQAGGVVLHANFTEQQLFQFVREGLVEIERSTA